MTSEIPNIKSERKTENFFVFEHEDISESNFPHWKKEVPLVEIERFNRNQGSLMGLAIGDALGAQVEFKVPGTFEHVSELKDGGTHHLEAGGWTDDTSMALCMAMSLIERHEYDERDILKKFLRWYRTGYLGSNGRCFDIGMTTSKSLKKYERDGKFATNKINEQEAGNGALMRLTPIPLFYAHDPLKALIKSGESSALTHRSPQSIDSCRYFGGLIVGALNGEPKEKLLHQYYSPVADYWDKYDLDATVKYVISGSYKTKNPPEIKAGGYVIDTLEAALWAFYHSISFEDGCIKAVNLGNDADTVGAVYGQLAGAYYGVDKIPSRWLDKIARRSLIEHISKELFFH